MAKKDDERGKRIYLQGCRKHPSLIRNLMSTNFRRTAAKLLLCFLLWVYQRRSTVYTTPMSLIIAPGSRQDDSHTHSPSWESYLQSSSTGTFSRRRSRTLLLFVLGTLFNFTVLLYFWICFFSASSNPLKKDEMLWPRSNLVR